MGAVVGCIASALGSCACAAVCSAMTSVSKIPAPRVPYLVLMFVALVSAMILKAYGGASLGKIYSFEIALCKSEECMGSQAVIRICAALAIFFATTTFTAFLTVKTGSFFAFQIIYFVGITIGMFFIKSFTFLTVFAGIARFASAIFLLVQMAVLIDFAYRWNESWVAKDQKKYYISIVVVSVLALIACVTFWGFFYNWFGAEGCDLERFFISFTIVLCSGLTILSLSEWAEKGALLPSAVVSFYCTYLLFSSLRNDPEGTCNSFNSQASSVGQIFLGFGMAAASIAYSSWSLSNAKLVDSEDDEALNRPLAARNDEERGSNKRNDHDDAEDDEDEDRRQSSSESYSEHPLRRGNIIFHVVMFLASFYASMLLTNWGIQLESSASSYSTIGVQTMWVNIVSQWCCVLLYLWTLVAPKLFPDREFL